MRSKFGVGWSAGTVQNMREKSRDCVLLACQSYELGNLETTRTFATTTTSVKFGYFDTWRVAVICKAFNIHTSDLASLALQALDSFVM